MNFIKNNLANAITLGNLFFGSVGVINLVTGNYFFAAICLVLCLVLDFFDGFVARAVNANSNLGGQLDSLADMVSFGLFPGVAMYKALEPFGSEIFAIDLPFDLKYFGLLIALFSCLRLAIFNLDDEQTYYFKGLNTPSNTMLIFGMYFAFRESGDFTFLFDNAVLLVLLCIFSSWLLISPVKMIALKFKSMKVKDNIPKLVLLAGIIPLLVIFKFAGIPLAIVYYIFVSLGFHKELSK